MNLWETFSKQAEELLAQYGEPVADEDGAYRFEPGWRRSTACLSPLEPFVALDFETTGLSSRYHEIIEIGAVRVMPGDVPPTTFHRLIQPSAPLPRSIVRLTGIDDELLAREGVDPCEALHELLDFTDGVPIVAYNAPFDLGFLNAACERYEAATQDVAYSCALALSRRAWPGLPTHKLDYVAGRLGLPSTDAHRALGDAQRAASVYRAATIECLNLHHLASAESQQRLRAMRC